MICNMVFTSGLSIVEVNCVICNNKEIKARKLQNKMGPEYIQMFRSPKEQIQNAEKKFKDERAR